MVVGIGAVLEHAAQAGEIRQFSGCGHKMNSATIAHASARIVFDLGR
jgi:hypothetical protein